MDFQIRPYSNWDQADVVELSLRAWAPVFESLRATLGPVIFERLHPDWRVDQQRAVETVLASQTTQVWLAEAGARIVGFVAVELDPSRRLGQVYMIAVDPSHQNHGIGERLTTFALDRMKEVGMTVAMVETGGDAGHDPARRTYEKTDFTLLPIARYFKAL